MRRRKDTSLHPLVLALFGGLRQTEPDTAEKESRKLPPKKASKQHSSDNEQQEPA